MDISLIEDHDQALKLWRRRALRGLTLVHVDAHADFRLPAAERPLTALSSALTVRDLKSGLEASLALLRYTKDFGRQTDIGNYLYAAWEEGIAREIYWVVPGDSGELRRNRNLLKHILRSALGRGARIRFNSSGADCRFRGSGFYVRTLDSLPRLRGVLLDIDADFMTTDSLRNAENTACIGLRKAACPPQELAAALRARLSNPALITIAYSTNGGYTPMRYRHLGDELAYRLEPRKFKARYLRSRAAAGHFSDFLSGGGAAAYWKAAKLLAAYRGPDNSLGMLYLHKGLLKKAEAEFSAVLAADPDNPQALSGAGQIAFRRREFARAVKYLRRALALSARGRFKSIRPDAWQVLGQAFLESGRLAQAQSAFAALRRAEPLRAHAYYYSGETAKRLGDYAFALSCYRSALQLGLASRTLEGSMRACARRVPGAIIDDRLFRRGKA